MKNAIVIGVDVGGTNSDCVIFDKQSKEVLGFAKTPTTDDITSGITKAVDMAIPKDFKKEEVICMSIGTTAFINAILEKSKKLARVAVLRLCGNCCKAILPFETFPKSLRNVVEGHWSLLPGGLNFNGSPIMDLDETSIVNECKILKEKNLRHIVVTSVFSPMDSAMEMKAKEIIEREIPNASVTMSHEVASLGLLERENASILNECLKPLAQATIKGFIESFEQLDLTCPFYLTQNDGTLISAPDAMNTPIFCISSGPTNSARGAYFLTGLKKAIVCDIGGTTSDIGILVDGFPRQSQLFVDIGGVKTNFRMPEVTSFPLGGGSIVRISNKTQKEEEEEVSIGPDSVGYLLSKKSKIFGGDTLTSTDVACVHYGLDIKKFVGATKENVEKVKKELSKVNGLEERIIKEIHRICEDGIDRAKTDDEEIPIILVGGGAVLLKEGKSKVGKFVIPEKGGVANALGAAIAQVSSELNVMVSFKPSEKDIGKTEEEVRKEVMERLEKECIQKCVQNGADESTVEIVNKQEYEIGYVGAVTGQKRVIMKAIGDIKEFKRIDASNIPDVSFDCSSSTKTASTLTDEDDASTKEDEKEIFRISKDYKPNLKGDEWILNEVDLKCISIGAGVLGCGGGGSTFIGELIGKKYLGKMIIKRWEDIEENTSVVPCAFMGAPSVMTEKLPNSEECIAAVKKGQEVSKNSSLPISGMMGGEIGGMNSLTPLYVAAKLGLNAYDIDLMGRAFPELQMFTNFIYSNNYNPTCLSNENGECVVKDDAKSCKEIEDELRKVVFMKFGGVGGLTVPPLSRGEVKEFAIKNTYSQSWRIGKAVLLARCENTDPVKAILSTVKGKEIFRGKITQLKSERIGGFDKVVMQIQGNGEFSEKENLEIIVQNENLVARVGGKVLACVPDLITLINPDDGSPIQTESLSFGLRVAVIVMPISNLMKTPKALEVVGPKAFKLEGVEYVPIDEIEDHVSVFDEFKS